MELLEAGTIIACVLALVILMVFCAYTWIKWRRNLTPAQDPEQPPVPKDQDQRLKTNSFRDGTCNPAVTMPSLDNMIDNRSEKAQEAKERDENPEPDYCMNGRRRGESFRDHKTRQETTYL